MPRDNQLKRPANGGRLSGRLSYFIRRALLNIRQNPFVNLLTITTITLALLIIALFLLVVVNLEGVTEQWSTRVQVTAYFTAEVPSPQLEPLNQRIRSMPEVDRVSYVGREAALQRFRERLRGQESLLQGVTADVMPASLEITLKRRFRTSEAVEQFVRRLREIPGIGEVQYGEEWVRKFSTFMSFLRLLGLLIGGFMVMAVLFIVSNTIRLTVYARRDEIELLSLVGATRFFIKAPFLIEGIVQGAAGGLLAVVILGGCYLALLQNGGNFLGFGPAMESLRFLPPGYLAGIIGGGVLLGFIGSITSLRRFISVEA